MNFEFEFTIVFLDVSVYLLYFQNLLIKNNNESS